MCNKQPPPPPPTTQRGTISFIPCKEHNLFAEQREKPTTSKGRSSRHVATRERENSRARESVHEHEAFARQVVLLLLLVLVRVLVLSRRAHSCSLSVCACAEHETQSTQATLHGTCSYKSSGNWRRQQHSQRNRRAVHTPRAQQQPKFIHFSDITNYIHTYLHTPWPPNTRCRKPTNTAK